MAGDTQPDRVEARLASFVAAPTLQTLKELGPTSPRQKRKSTPSAGDAQKYDLAAVCAAVAGIANHAKSSQ
jgi:hypothetical protein